MIIPFRRRTTRTRPATTRPVPSRLVHTRRWIDTRHLELGMYVVELDRPWADTPFDFQGFRLDSRALIAEVRATSNMALVETEKLATADGRVRLGPVVPLM